MKYVKQHTLFQLFLKESYHASKGCMHTVSVKH